MNILKKLKNMITLKESNPTLDTPDNYPAMPEISNNSNLKELTKEILKIDGKWKIISHNDLDGVGSVVVAKTFLNITETKYVSNNNKNEHIEEAVKELREGLVDYLLITDISPTDETIEVVDKAVRDGYKIFLVDHHKTAIQLNEYSWATVEIENNGVLNSATSLLYRLFEERGCKYIPLEVLCEKVRRYDTWDWVKLNDEIPKQINSLFWIYGEEAMEEKLLKKIIKKEPLITDFEEELLLIEEVKTKRYVDKKLKEVKLAKYNDLKVGYVYADQYTNDLAMAIYNSIDVDFVAIVNFKSVGLRTNKDVDVSVIAKLFNGGGHPKASGFPIPETIKETFINNFFQ